jgi:rhamnogalacturonyl hydrolase YesR
MKTPLAVFLFSLALISGARAAPTPARDGAGMSDASIREILRVVARHQRDAFGPAWGTGKIAARPPLTDGDYAAVATLDAARAARAPAGIEWDYPWGVTLYGMLRSVDATGDTEIGDWVRKHDHIVARYYAWLETVHGRVGDTEAWKAFARKTSLWQLLALGDLDFCGAMGAEFLEEMLRQPEKVIPEQKAVVERVANWIVERQDRLPDGTLWRPTMTAAGKGWPLGTIWADDLYMSCPFLIRWAAYTKNGKYLTDAAHQILNMAARLQDADGVWFHAYNVPLRQHSPFKWGRANGWALVTTAEVLSVLPENHPDRAALLEIFRRHAAGVIKYQPASGVWANIVDRTDIWPETSCTLMFAYAIARGVNRGWLPREDLAAARKAFAGVVAGYVTPEGVLKGTVRGTGIGLTLDYYARRERYDDDLHGRGVLLLAGTEILNPGR